MDAASTPESTPVPRRPIRHAVGWVLAAIAVALGFFALSVAGIIVYLFAAALSGGTVDALSDEMALAASAAGELIALALYARIWLRVREGAFGSLRRLPGGCDAKRVARAIAALFLSGLGLQVVVSVVVSSVLQFFPEVAVEYNELMEASGSGDPSFASVLSVAILAPLVEEVACRGLMLEFLLRAFEPRWNGRARARSLEPSRTAVAAALFLQGGIFALMHLNVVQSSYSLLIGVFLGWLYWRTGSLWYGIGLHLAVNASSFILEPLLVLLEPWGGLGLLVLAYACGYGIRQLVVLAERPPREPR